MFSTDDESTGSALGYWSETLADLHARIAHRFARAKVRQRVGRYLAALLGRVERNNGWSA